MLVPDSTLAGFPDPLGLSRLQGRSGDMGSGLG